jgi:protein arginine kinase activator
MKCHFCDAEATVHLTEVVNGQMVELHLCAAHAQEKGADFSQGFPTADFFSAFSNLFAGPELLEGQARLSCSHCGMTYTDFTKSGRLGCEKCYETFKEILIPLIQRVQRAGVHHGKSPLPGDPKKRKRESEVQQLQAKLKTAIAAEDYEEAARLRDAIKKAEAAEKGSGKADGS